MTLEAKNRRIAIGLGWRESANERYGAPPPDFEYTQLYPDFYTDEAANALVLEKMPEPELWLESDPGQPRVYGCIADIQNPEHTCAFGEKRTAIAEAFIKWIDSLQNIPENLRSGGSE